MSDEEANQIPTRPLSELVEESAPGLIREYWTLVRREGKWFLLPLLLTLLVAGGFVVLGSTGAGPLLYALF